MKKRVVYVNGSFVDEDKANVSVFDRGFLFGDGIYEVMMQLEHGIFYKKAHLDRLQDNLDKIGINYNIEEIDDHLEELLAARKATRKKIKTTDDEFMKNVLDKRQLSYKITANSLYGQCGAKTSSFYEKDVAASTTATGRKLLIYAKHIIEEVYGDRIVETSLGKVHSHAEYIYGDTDSVFMSFKLTELDGTPITGRKASFGSKKTIIEAFKKNDLTNNLIEKEYLNMKIDKNNILKFY